VVGAFFSARLRNSLTTEALVRATFLVFAAAVALTAFSAWIWLTMLALCAAGACWVLSLSTFNATVQLSAPRWVVGRALALYQMATFGGMAVGADLGLADACITAPSTPCSPRPARSWSAPRSAFVRLCPR